MRAYRKQGGMKKFIKRNPEAKFLISNLGCNLFFIIIDKEYLKDLLVEKIHDIIDMKTDHKHPLDRMTGTDNLAFSEGPAWKSRRKLHSFGFTFENVKELTPKMSEIIERIRLKMEKKPLNNVILLDYLNSMTGHFTLEAILGSNNIPQVTKEGENVIIQFPSLLQHLLNRALSPFFLVFGKKFFDPWYFLLKINISTKDV